MPYLDTKVRSLMLRDGGGWEYGFDADLSGTDEMDIEEFEDLPWNRVSGGVRGVSGTKWYLDHQIAEPVGRLFYERLAKEGRGTQIYVHHYGSMSVIVFVDEPQEALWKSTLDAAFKSDLLEIDLLIGRDMGAWTEEPSQYGGRYIFFEGLPELRMSRKPIPEKSTFSRLLGLTRP